MIVQYLCTKKNIFTYMHNTSHNIILYICHYTVEVTDSSVNNQSTRDWDPMQSDYLSRRNKYSIDDEDVGSALLGYSEELIQPER